MKKLLIALALAALLPAMALGGTMDYQLVSTKISGSGTLPWSSSATADTMTNFTLLCGVGTGSGWIIPETTAVIPTASMVCPIEDGAFAGIFIEQATADSVRVTPQVSCDKESWLSLTAVDLVGTTDFDPIIEASTAVSTPMWPYMRFIISNYEGGKAATAVSTASVTIWFNRYEKTY